MYIFVTTFKTALGLSQPGVLFLGVKGAGREANLLSQLVSNSRKRGALGLFLHTPHDGVLK